MIRQRRNGEGGPVAAHSGGPTCEAAVVGRGASAPLDFAQAVGHELRAPLTVAIGHLELIGEGGEDAAEVMPLVLDELARMGRILDDLQALALAEHQDYVIPSAVDADVLAVELLAKSRAFGTRVWQLAPTSSVTFGADRDRLTEAVLNLVDNAVKSTVDGDTIAIGVRLVRREVHVTVEDTGCGITPEDLERIFERFERGRRACRAYRGAGLGLSIVRSIAAAHGGRVDVRSTFGAGTRMTIAIPFRRPASAGDQS